MSADRAPAPGSQEAMWPSRRDILALAEARGGTVDASAVYDSLPTTGQIGFMSMAYIKLDLKWLTEAGHLRQIDRQNYQLVEPHDVD